MRFSARVLVAALAVALALPASSFAADWKGSFDASYQAAQPGDVITVPAGTYGNQTIQYRGSVANLSGGCTPSSTAKCIAFVMGGSVTVGKLEIRGSSVWVQGGDKLRATGYIDTEADSTANHPDHVIVQDARATSFGVFNADTVTFRNLDVGPATVFWNGSSEVCCREGSGMENKIGSGGGVSYVPREITLDGLRIHDQNGDASRLQPGADVHFGGLFLQSADGLTVRNSVFERNVVYHVQVQNFGNMPPAKRVVFDNNSFGCPVDWLYVTPLRCDGQHPIQFDYDVGSEFTLTNNVAAYGGGLFQCYVGTCGGLAGVKANQRGNVILDNAVTAPPLLNGNTPPPPPPPPPTCPGTSLTLSKVAETASTVTLAWQPPTGAIGYRFSATGNPKRSHTWDGTVSTVRFAKLTGGGCYRVETLFSGPDGGFPG